MFCMMLLTLIWKVEGVIMISGIDTIADLTVMKFLSVSMTSTLIAFSNVIGGRFMLIGLLEALIVGARSTLNVGKGSSLSFILY